MPKYIALLRGINVGGNKKIKMEALRKQLATLGFENIKTVLASGNVVFDAKTKSTAKLVKQIEELIEKEYGFGVPTIIVPALEMEELKKSEPFKDIEVTKETRLYVSFLPEKPDTDLILPYKVEDSTYEILAIYGRVIASVLILQGNARTIDAMAVLDKEFGKNITTRNWNTVEKILKLL